MHQVLFEQFVASFESAPEELIPDFDCTDDRVHGLQEGRHFHGFYYDFCFLPLYVFSGERLLVSYLRESNIILTPALLSAISRTQAAFSHGVAHFKLVTLVNPPLRGRKIKHFKVK